MQFGTTFSHRHIRQLGLDPVQSLERVIGMGFAKLRLCIYWDEVQPSPDAWNVEEVRRYLVRCTEHKQQVVLVIGMKSPRWPEFYVPTWAEEQLEGHLLQFIERAVRELKAFSCITHWQVENEPLDPSGPQNQKVEFALLEKEVATVRKHDERPVLLTAWGNAARRRNVLPNLAELSDVVGIDVYYKQYSQVLMVKTYKGPEDNEKSLSEYLKRLNTPVWITELQAEPWEKNEHDYLSDAPPSCSDRLLKEYVEKAMRLPVEVIFFWGVEYWLWRAERGDSCYLELWNRLKKES